MDSRDRMDSLRAELFELVRMAASETGMPYASLLVDRRSGVVVAKDYNTSLKTLDPSDQCAVTGVRKAKQALETDDLSHLRLFSFFEPTVLSFDLAMFAKITDFAWCINAADAPEHYLIKDYSLRLYEQQHPGDIHITAGYARDEALRLLKTLDLNIPSGHRLSFG